MAGNGVISGSAVVRLASSAAPILLGQVFTIISTHRHPPPLSSRTPVKGHPPGPSSSPQETGENSQFVSSIHRRGTIGTNHPRPHRNPGHGGGSGKEFFLLADRDHRMPDFLSVASDYIEASDQTLSGKGKTRGEMIIAPECNAAGSAGTWFHGHEGYHRGTNLGWAWIRDRA
jgi:hypothetical protein